jgi:phage terminase small subunit
MLTERQLRFVEFYMGEAVGNATKAAILAGYSRTTARKQASRLLTKGNIQMAIDERSGRDPVAWTRQQRQAFWTRIAADPAVTIRDRLKASELLARSQGDFVEKRLLQLEGSGQPTLAQIIAGTAREPFK